MTAAAPAFPATLIQAHELLARMNAGGAGAPLVLDCSFDLSDPGAGERAYRQGHIPGARHLHLDHALSAPKNGSNGRHPLPTRDEFARTMAALGANDDTPIVAYDNSGSMYAARLWWMLRWAGHPAVAVLDGGLAAWKAAGAALSTDSPGTPGHGRFSLRPPLARAVEHAGIRANLQSGGFQVLDARAPDRFRGENETLDPVAGHIPGARNRLFRNNLDASGVFKPAQALRAEFEAVLAGRPASEIVHQCGSGVTACHNLLAMEVAGLSGSALYPGSWSEYCAQPGAPIATGEA